jgi:predicted TIM-barrel fold metal-dependent hydrolase
MRMYSGPIIDPHIHLWDLSMGKHAWLQPSEGGVQALGGLDKLRADFLVADYLRDSAHQPIEAAVHIEALWDRADIVGETRWLETLDKSRGIAARYVAAAPFGTDAAARIIDEQAAFSRVVGIRDILSFHPTNPAKNFAQRDGIAYDPAWRADVFRLVAHNLSLELMMYPYQLSGVVDLARARPELQIIVNHCASPIDRDEDGMAHWREAVAALGREPNIAIKVSNIGAYDPAPTYESIRAVALHCIESFGTGRAMLGTDWPVARLHSAYDDIWDQFRRVTESFTPAEQSALFHDNAKRFYRL